MVSPAHIWPAALPGAPNHGRVGGGMLDGSKCGQGRCGDSFLGHVPPPALPEVLDLISRPGIRKEFSTCQSGRNHRDFCFPLCRAVANIWAYQLPMTTRDTSIRNASGSRRRMPRGHAQPLSCLQGPSPPSHAGLGQQGTVHSTCTGLLVAHRTGKRGNNPEDWSH